jgi:membrane-associated phospholipid phosphatase
MPSLHAGIPFLMAIALWKYPVARWLGAAYAVSMLFSIVYLGEHYAIDGFAGWAAAAVAWVGVTRAIAWWDNREPRATTRNASTRAGGRELVNAPYPYIARTERGDSGR